MLDSPPSYEGFRQVSSIPEYNLFVCVCLPACLHAFEKKKARPSAWVCVVLFYNRHRDAEDPTEDPPKTPTPGRRSSWVKEEQKVWRCVSVSEDPPPPGDTL